MILDRLKHMIHVRRDLAELAQLSDHDLADLGVNRAEAVDMIRMPPDTPRRMALMAALFGVTETRLHQDPAAYVDMLRGCGHCADRGACARVLSKAELRGPQDAAFCPNSPAFVEMAKA